LNSGTPGPLYKRLLWMAAIWLAGVLALGAVAGVIRIILRGYAS